jgi:hypothetical protein
LAPATILVVLQCAADSHKSAAIRQYFFCFNALLLLLLLNNTVGCSITIAHPSSAPRPSASALFALPVGPSCTRHCLSDCCCLAARPVRPERRWALDEPDAARRVQRPPPEVVDDHRKNNEEHEEERG